IHTTISRRCGKVEPRRGGLNLARRFNAWDKGETMRIKGKRPTFLIFMVDEERSPPVYETDEVRAWRRAEFKAQDQLRRTGMEFHRHYAGATACSPSRATIFTGQYPSLHGVTQTTGTAK